MSSDNSNRTDRYGTVMTNIAEQRFITDYSHLAQRETELIAKLTQVLTTTDNFNCYRFMDFCTDVFMDEGFIDFDIMGKIFTTEFNDDINDTAALLRNVKKAMSPDEFKQFAQERAAYLAKRFIFELKTATKSTDESKYSPDRAKADIDKMCQATIDYILATFSKKTL